MSDTISYPLEATGIHVGYGADDVLHDVSLHPGRENHHHHRAEWLWKVHPAEVLLAPAAPAYRNRDAGRHAAAYPAPQRNRGVLAVSPQRPVAPDGMTVTELVRRGRQPHQPWYRQWSAEDEEITNTAMRDTHVADWPMSPSTNSPVGNVSAHGSP